ncbi:hypothetical protein BH09BAC4_BH09BAC4_37780 [soil metagenome]
MKNTILIACTIINAIVTLIALIFVFKVDVTWTGPLGDTFGGLLSPLIGGISIYFIYKTFDAQREQLADQIRATNFSGSSLYFSEVSAMISDVRSKFNVLHYGEHVDEKVGEEAIKAIKSDLLNFKLPDNFLRNAFPLLRYLNEQMSRIALVATIGNNIDDNYLKELCKDKFKNELAGTIEQTLSVFEEVRRSLDLMQKKDEYYQNNSMFMSFMASQYESYLKSINSLHELGNVVTKTDFPDRIYEMSINKISHTERLGRIDLTSKWSAK